MRLGKQRKTDLIKQVPLFSNASRRELEQVAALADEIDLPEGKQIIREGERGREFFVIIDGEVDVRRGNRKLKTLGSGDFVGEIALVSRVPRTASVTTRTPVRALVITDRDFRSLLERTPEMQIKVLEALGQRLAETLGDPTL